MDLGIRGRKALVCAASKGLGRASAEALAAEGVAVTITGRDEAKLAETTRDIAEAHGVVVRYAAGDIATEAGRAVALAACPDPDILINNAGGPPPGPFEQFDRDAWIAALDANMLSPILLIREVHAGMRARKFGRIVNITSAMIKAPIDLLPLSAGARLGLTGAVASLARQGAADNVTINALLPEMFDTDRLRGNFRILAERAGHSVGDETNGRIAQIPAGRLGEPAEFGQLCAYLCSAQAGYITGQNIVVDGGTYPGIF